MNFRWPLFRNRNQYRRRFNKQWHGKSWIIMLLIIVRDGFKTQPPVDRWFRPVQARFSIVLKVMTTPGIGRNRRSTGGWVLKPPLREKQNWISEQEVFGKSFQTIKIWRWNFFNNFFQSDANDSLISVKLQTLIDLVLHRPRAVVFPYLIQAVFPSSIIRWN